MQTVRRRRIYMQVSYTTRPYNYNIKIIYNIIKSTTLQLILNYELYVELVSHKSSFNNSSISNRF